MSSILPNLLSIRRTFRLRPEEDAELALEAKQHGYGLSTFIRIKLLDRTKGLCIRAQPTPDMPALHEASSTLHSLIIALPRLEAVLVEIAERLDKGSRDLFGPDGCLLELRQTITLARLTSSAVNKAIITRMNLLEIPSSAKVGQEDGK